LVLRKEFNVKLINCQLTGWGTAIDCVYGAQVLDFSCHHVASSQPHPSQEISGSNLSESGDDDVALGVKAANEQTYDTPFEIGYETPCVEISFSEDTKRMLNAKFQKIMSVLDTRMNEKRIGDPEITARLLRFY